MGNSTNIFAPQVRIIQPAFVYKDSEDIIYIWNNDNKPTSAQEVEYE